MSYYIVLLPYYEFASIICFIDSKIVKIYLHINLRGTPFDRNNIITLNEYSFNQLTFNRLFFKTRFSKFHFLEDGSDYYLIVFACFVYNDAYNDLPVFGYVKKNLAGQKLLKF